MVLGRLLEQTGMTYWTGVGDLIECWAELSRVPSIHKQLTND